MVVTGCSFTAGIGWVNTNPTTSSVTEAKDSPLLWVNLCHQQINQLTNLELLNISSGGSSNSDIFETTLNAMATYQHIDTIFVQWTSGPRYNFNTGFELWDTSESFNQQLNNIPYRHHDVKLNNGNTWPRKYITDIINRFKVLHHIHWEIIKIVRYTNILNLLSKKLGIRVIFINGICPWDKNYFVQLSDSVKPEEYTNFTKTDILNIKNRNDDEILKLYKLAHHHYNKAGGIDPSCWVNLYNSMKDMQVDTNYDQHHPGAVSNQLYFEAIKNFLN